MLNVFVLKNKILLPMIGTRNNFVVFLVFFIIFQR